MPAVVGQVRLYRRTTVLHAGTAAVLAFLGLAAVAPEPSETVVVVAEGASVRLGNRVVAAVGKGRWLGVLGRGPEGVEVQVCVGTELRGGWVEARHVAVLADASVDLAAEALEIARILRPELDVAAARVSLDALIERVAAEAAGGATPREKARRVGSALFEREGFAAGEPHTLDAVLDQHRGNCLGLSLLYLCVARKLGIPAHLVTAPKHVLVQWGAGQDRVYIETTRNGSLHESLGYLAEHLGQQQAGEAGGIHLAPLSAAQAVGVLLKEAGRTFRDAAKYDEAFRLYARAIEINPRHADAYVGFGAALIGLGENAAACEPCATAARLNPRDPEAHCYWGVALRRLRRHADACERYARAVALRPRFDKAWCNWGVALERMGIYAQACEKHARAVAINPQNQDALYNWGVSLARLKRYAEACEKFARAVELKPRDASARFYWGVALHQLGRDEAACEKFAAVVALAPRFAPAYRAWAAALAQMGKEAEAAGKLERATQLEREGQPKPAPR
jgi:tetratricopeptide (TPR) repeat protein